MKILAIMWKDILVRFSDRSEFLFFLILPVIFTFLLSGGANGNADAALPLLVADEDRSSLSGELLSSLGRDGMTELVVVSSGQARKQFAQKEAAAWLTIPAGFEADLLAGLETRLVLEKTPNNRNADILERSVRAASSSLNRSLSQARQQTAAVEQRSPFSSDVERQVYLASRVKTSAEEQKLRTPRVIAARPESLNTSSYDPSTQASSGQLITWVLIPLLGTSALFSLERNQKTLQRLVTSPTRKATFLLGTILGQLAAAMVQMTILIGFGALVLKVNWGRSPLALALIMVSFGLASVALGTALGTFLKSEKQANNLSIMFGMTLALLGGCWWPMELFPEAMQMAVRILPTTWAMQAFIDLTLRGAGPVQILPAVGVLLGFAAIFFVIGTLRFRYE